MWPPFKRGHLTITQNIASEALYWFCYNVHRWTTELKIGEFSSK